VIEEKNINIFTSVLPNVMCDANDFKQVMYNLISNAVKFSNPTQQSVIRIQCLSKEDFYEFSVKDNGIGFEMKYHDQLFGIFKTLSSEDRQKGSGIGLSLCKKIINNYGGQIWAESVIGQGSTFYFTIPK
jgi:light-regulated signal transduction histidine kinase (bacteriophytochrome)